MGIESLLNVPRSPEDWNRYTFNLREATTNARQAIQRESNGADRLFEYELDPAPPTEKDDWLARVQQSLNDINGVLNLQGNDVTGVDFTSPQQTEAWVNNIFQQYQSINESLGI